MIEGNSVSDLQLYHSLKNRISELERLLNNANSRVDKHRQASKEGNDREARKIKAETLLSLKSTGVIDWSIKMIAKECFLSTNRVSELNIKYK